MPPCVVVKIGTKVLTNPEGDLELATIKHLTEQIVELKKSGVRVVLVSSGAVGAGRLATKLPDNLGETASRQVYAAIGQARLMGIYGELLAVHGIICAQVLATKEDFRDKVHYYNMRSCFENMLHDDILPIVNENDVVAISELIFTDNDELAGLVASMLSADALVILSGVDGLLDAAGQVIRRVQRTEIDEAASAIHTATSDSGRGGMVTKFAIARTLTAQGIEVYIADGKQPGILQSVLAGRAGTAFEPAAKKTRAFKRRLAHSDGLATGAARISPMAEERLVSDQTAASLLPIGITAVTGNFEKGDIIEIQDQTGRRLGFGVAEYSAGLARTEMGKKQASPLVLYDRMFIE